MVVRRLQPDELYHHGIKGQKWGKKNGPPYPLGSEISTGKSLKKIANNVSRGTNKVVRRTTTKVNSTVKKVEKVDEKYQISEKTKKIIKAALITAGVLTLAGAAAYGYNLKRKLGSDVLLNNVKMRRYQQFGTFNTNDGGSAYISTGMLDKFQYKKYARDQKSTFKLDLVGNNLSIPSIKNSRNIFANQLNDSTTKKELADIFSKNLEYYKGKTMTPPNIKRVKLFKESIARIKKGEYSENDIKVLYDAWNTSITNNSILNTWGTTNRIFDIFKQKGYNTIWDTHDLYISGYHSKNPMIVFDKTNLTVKSSKKMSKAELQVGGLTGDAVTVGKNYISLVQENMYKPIRLIESLTKENLKPYR